LIKSKFLFDEIDQIKFLDKENNLLLDSVLLDIEQGVFSRPSRIEEYTLKNIPKEEIILKNDLKQNLANSNFLTQQTQRLVDENNFAASEFVNKNLIVHTFSKILLENNETLTIVISEISNEIMLAVEERKTSC